VEISQENLDRIKADPHDFYLRCVTADETWLHYYDPDSKQSLMQWKHTDSPPPRKFRTHASAMKVLATIFWDAQGVIRIDYLPRGSTINSQYHADLLMQLRSAIKEKRRRMLSRGVWLLHHNTLAHTAKVAQAALHAAGFEQLPHRAYSPDLAPSDYYLFRHLKVHLLGRRFADDNEVCRATQEFLSRNVRPGFQLLCRCLSTVMKSVLMSEVTILRSYNKIILAALFLHVRSTNLLGTPRTNIIGSIGY
jgi:histone-lysine N-methyltransferase SETMAR